MEPYISNHKPFYKKERGLCPSVFYEPYPPLGSKNTFPFFHNPSLKWVTKNCKSVACHKKRKEKSLESDLEALPEYFWAASGMVGNIRMSNT